MFPFFCFLLCHNPDNWNIFFNHNSKQTLFLETIYKN